MARTAASGAKCAYRPVTAVVDWPRILEMSRRGTAAVAVMLGSVCRRVRVVDPGPVSSRITHAQVELEAGARPFGARAGSTRMYPCVYPCVPLAG